jgi:hypothetical protein
MRIKEVYTFFYRLVLFFVFIIFCIDATVNLHLSARNLHEMPRFMSQKKGSHL